MLYWYENNAYIGLCTSDWELSKNLSRTKDFYDIFRTWNRIDRIVFPTDISDSKTLIWTTDNENVVDLSNGTVTAKNAGTATITVSSGNITATSNITVEENTVTPPITEGLTAKFEVTASWASSIQFRITITNNTNGEINITPITSNINKTKTTAK